MDKKGTLKRIKEVESAIGQFQQELRQLKDCVKEEERTYKVGDRFMWHSLGCYRECILSYVGRGEDKLVCLIALNTGIRFKLPSRVSDINSITQEEFNKLAVFPESFKLKE